MAAASTAAAVGAAFARASEGAFALEDSWERRLAHEPWPAARYAELVVRPLAVGRWVLGYRFERTRPGQARSERVHREISVEVLPAGERRVIVLDFPYRFPIVLGDSLAVPVPLDDPWGSLSDLTWNVPRLEPGDEPPFSPPACPTATTLPPPRPVGAALELAAVGCTWVMLANLQTRTTIWQGYRAKSGGPAPALRVEVLDGTGPVLAPVKSFVERVVGGASSSTSLLDREAVVPLRVGDEVWTRNE